MGKICVDHDTETGMFTVVGSSKTGDFVISGPWTKRELAEAHARRIIGVFNEAAQEIIDAAKKPLIYAP